MSELERQLPTRDLEKAAGPRDYREKAKRQIPVIVLEPA